MLVCKCDMCTREIPEKGYKVMLTEGKLDMIEMGTRRVFDMCEKCVTTLFEGLVRNDKQ